MLGREPTKPAEIVYLRSSAVLKGPPKQAIVEASPINRWRSAVDTSLWLRIENTLDDILGTEITLWILSLVLGVGVLAIAMIFFGAHIAGLEDIAIAVLVVAGVGLVAKMATGILTVRVRSSYAHRGDKRRGSDTLQLTFNQADKVTDKAQSILKECIGENKLDAIRSVKTDRDAPYRLIKNLLPIGPFFFRRPRLVRAHELNSIQYRNYRMKIDMADALCAGILGSVGARPRLRYNEDTEKPLAQDRFWRADVQQLHDTGVSDVFLRFHQSTVESEFPPTSKSVDVCMYKTYAAINNFRVTPLYLLRVKDVVDCLLCRHEAFAKDLQEQIYADLSIDAARAFHLLQAGKFSKSSARADRFNFERSTEMIGQPILAYANEDDKDDIIMSFDPGRVWPRPDAASEYVHAVIALRRAIHLASRKLAIQIAPVRQDVLLVDNLRMMICRREDEPTGLGTPMALGRDILAAAFRPLAGRWLRQIYGFPPSVSNAPSSSELTSATAAEAGAAALEENPAPRISVMNE